VRHLDNGETAYASTRRLHPSTPSPNQASRVLLLDVLESTSSQNNLALQVLLLNRVRLGCVLIGLWFTRFRAHYDGFPYAVALTLFCPLLTKVPNLRHLDDLIRLFLLITNRQSALIIVGVTAKPILFFFSILILSGLD